ncbi:retron Ec78 anti-phage system effector HNH endonuclease PtuB [Sphaerotilus uruguayifluvii]|uniref:Uncharacterized protein (TIGR02646 family) n=1 Tax=Sphaerotilus uruguayifluvii TaxID=2735897 RepID=A0ABX2GA29_9BURK|nr:retron Ec78 anti-phage system effector HNH endonuclease PtuB [Leptothrix sp. C29]NRT58388.1 uncharacterized protein (TIGR02646 family) [Leptothrix sp. C29]
MHKLNRDPAIPGGLQNYRHGQDQWSDTCPNADERGDIWNSFGQMQGWRCAYCETDVSDTTKRHIEHFRQRSRHPQGTFDWHNLFGSCNRAGTCGDHKDKCGNYPHEVLIKPDVEDPENFLLFLPNGTVCPRNGLSDEERHRAEETIRILKLDGALNQIRREAVRHYIKTAEAFAEMAQEYPENEWLPELENEIIRTSHLPFATAIKHVLSNQSA